MTSAVRPWLTVSALIAILTITASWWALALWPADAGTPAWVIEARAVCFGAARGSLPNAGGWLLLVGQPFGMLAILIGVWGGDLREGLIRATRHVTGQVALGGIAACVMLGLFGAGVRVVNAGADPFVAGAASPAGALTRIDDAAPALSLVDQSGRLVTLDEFRGRPVLVTFAYAHCDTVCPFIVADVLRAQQTLGEASPAVLLITLDPWRDTPARLPAIAEGWRLGSAAHVLSGPPEIVDRTLNAWRVPRARNERTGDLSHPSIVYVVTAAGRIRFALTGGADAIVAAVGALKHDG